MRRKKKILLIRSPLIPIQKLNLNLKIQTTLKLGVIMCSRPKKYRMKSKIL